MFFRKPRPAAVPAALPDAARAAYSTLHSIEEETDACTRRTGVPDLVPEVEQAHRRRAAARVMSAGQPAFAPGERLTDELALRDLAEHDREVADRAVGVQECEHEVTTNERALEDIGAPAAWWMWTRLGLAAAGVSALGTVALGLLLVESMDLFVLRPYWRAALHDERLALEASRHGAWWLAFCIAACFVGLPPLIAVLAGGLSTRAKVVILALELGFAAAFGALRLQGAVTGQLLAWTGFELAIAGTALVLAFHVSHAVAAATVTGQAARRARQSVTGARRRLEEARVLLATATARRDDARHQVAVREWDTDARERLRANAEESVALQYQLTTRELSERAPNPFDSVQGAALPAPLDRRSP